MPSSSLEILTKAYAVNDVQLFREGLESLRLSGSDAAFNIEQLANDAMSGNSLSAMEMRFRRVTHPDEVFFLANGVLPMLLDAYDNKHDVLATNVILYNKTSPVFDDIARLVADRRMNHLPKWKSRDWQLLERVLEKKTYEDAVVLSGTVTGILVHGGYDELSDDMKGRMMRIANLMKVESQNIFLIEHGCNALLMHLLDGVERASIVAMLVRCPHVEYVVHAPALGKVIEQMIKEQTTADLVAHLIRRGGTSFLLRLMMEAFSLEDTVKSMWTPGYLPRTSRAAFCALWPTRLANILGDQFLPPTTMTGCTYECPITMDVCIDPVVASDGYTYERDAILRHILNGGTSPMTRDPIDSFVVPNMALFAGLNKRVRE